MRASEHDLPGSGSRFVFIPDSVQMRWSSVFTELYFRIIHHQELKFKLFFVLVCADSFSSDTVISSLRNDDAVLLCIGDNIALHPGRKWCSALWLAVSAEEMMQLMNSSDPQSSAAFNHHHSSQSLLISKHRQWLDSVTGVYLTRPVVSYSTAV